MISEKHEKLSILLDDAISKLEIIIKDNKNTDYVQLYDSVLKCLKYYKEKSDNNDDFEFERDNMGFNLLRCFDGVTMEADFEKAICAIGVYFFNEFVLK